MIGGLGHRSPGPAVRDSPLWNWPPEKGIRIRHQCQCWVWAIEAESTLFRILVAKDRAERDGDAAALAEIDQLIAGIKDERRSARHKLHRLRARLRRLRSGGGPAGSSTPGSDR